MKKQWMIFLIIVSITGDLLLTGCSNHKEEQADMEDPVQSNIVQLTTEAIQRTGLTTVIVSRQNASNQITTTAEIKANEDRVFHINSFVGGRISKDNVFLGDAIHSGQTLAVVQNLEVAKIQADYIHQLHQNEVEIQKAKTRHELAQKNMERERHLLAEGISPRKDYLQAQNDVALTQADLAGEQEHNIHIRAEGKALLSAYGLTPNNAHSEKVRTDSPVKAPRSGVIIRKNITLGDMVTPDTVMYEVADLSQVWLDMTIHPKDLSSVQTGQTILFTTDSQMGKTFTGRIDYIQPIAQEASQTYVARAYLDNTSGLLKPGMFGQVQIIRKTKDSKPFVPEGSIQKYGKENFVFVVLNNNRFRKQAIQLGEKVTDGYLIDAGVKPGDQIVGKGSFTLKAEMLKGQFAEEEE